jgi:hypothetical protein
MESDGHPEQAYLAQRRACPERAQATEWDLGGSRERRAAFIQKSRRNHRGWVSFLDMFDHKEA